MESGEYKMVQIKRENEYDIFDAVFDTTEVKYEPCQSGSGKYDVFGGDHIDWRNAYSEYEEQKEEKYVAVQLNSEDVDFTDASTIHCKAEQVKSEFDCNIQYGEVKIEFDETMPGKSELYCGEKVFQCSICSKTFAGSGNLKRHGRIHTGEKPFVCKICSKAFTNSHDMKDHERIHTGERPFQCNICFKAFTQSGSLKVHERIHTGDKPFHCKICSKAFTRSSGLKIHERIHTGEKPFNCKICSKAYTESKYLKRHERIHTEEK